MAALWPWRSGASGAGGHVAPLAPRDAGSVAGIHAESFARPWDAHEIERMLADPMVIGEGLFDGTGRRLDGFVLSRQVLDEAEILTIAVAKSRRGSGLARRLLTTHLATLAARKVATLHLEVEEGNAPALALYRRLGFVEVGRRKGYYRTPEGPAAALLLSLALGE